MGCTDDFVPDNPVDPENPEYIPPILTITSGPLDGDILDTSAVTFTWDGNEDAMLFRYKFDENIWSSWHNAKSATFDYLDEREYQFRIQSKYTTGDTSQVVFVGFEIDAVKGPALMFYPRRKYLSQGSNGFIEIHAEEVFDFTAAEFVIEYDPSSISIESILEGSLFSEAQSTFFFWDDDSQNGKISITIGVWDNLISGVKGTGVISTIQFQVLIQGETVLLFDGTEVIRDFNNNTIGINETISGLIVGQ